METLEHLSDEILTTKNNFWSRFYYIYINKKATVCEKCESEKRYNALNEFLAKDDKNRTENEIIANLKRVMKTYPKADYSSNMSGKYTAYRIYNKNGKNKIYISYKQENK